MSRLLAVLASQFEASSVVTPISSCRHCRRVKRGPVRRARWGCLSVNRRGRPSCGGLLTFRLLPKAPRRRSGRAARPLAVSSPVGSGRQTARHSASAAPLFVISSFPGCSQSGAAAHSQIRGRFVHKTISSRSVSHRGPFSVSRARNLTPPSSGRSEGRFAPFGPPLMSNVRPHKEYRARSLHHQ